MSEKLNLLEIGKFQWILNGDFVYIKNCDGTLLRIEIKDGTKTDGYSIPRFLHWLITPDCMDLIPAVIHDQLTRLRWYDSKVVHSIFAAMVEELDEPKWKRFAVIYAVFLFGPRF